jgi:hypothetical protein
MSGPLDLVAVVERDGDPIGLSCSGAGFAELQVAEELQFLPDATSPVNPAIHVAQTRQGMSDRPPVDLAPRERR